MNSHRPDALDEALSKLPKSVPTERDLWPRIQAQIEAERPGKDARRGFPPRWYQLGAGVLLVLASSVTTFVILRDAQERAPAGGTRSVASHTGADRSGAARQRRAARLHAALVSARGRRAARARLVGDDVRHHARCARTSAGRGNDRAAAPGDRRDACELRRLPSR